MKNEDSNCKEVDFEKTELVILECDCCGYHFGVDATYLTQICTIEQNCPSCKILHVIGGD